MKTLTHSLNHLLFEAEIITKATNATNEGKSNIIHKYLPKDKRIHQLNSEKNK